MAKRGRKAKSLEQQIHGILEKYVDDVVAGTNAAIDKGATLCKEKVKADSPTSESDIIRYRNTNALVETASGKKKTEAAGFHTHKKGSYAKGWSVKKDPGLKNGIRYGKRIYNRKYPHLTHLLENGHNLVNSKGHIYGHVKAFPHIEKNGEEYAEKVKQEIDNFLKKGKNYD